MKKVKITRILLVLLLLPLLLQTVDATQSLWVSIAQTPDSAAVGETVTLVVSLNNYTADMAGIMDIQVDITAIDPEFLEVVSHVSKIVDDAATSNKTSYNATNKRVRLAYVNFSDNTLPVSATGTVDLLEVVLRVNENLTEDGTITLPVTTKITVGTEFVTLTDEVVINYTVASVDPKPTYDVDVSWGSLAYTYTDPVWDTGKHTYTGGGWTVDETGGDQISLTNNGESTVTAKLSYATDRTDITAGFDRPELTLEAAASATAKLSLSGKPSEALYKTPIGTVTVTLE